MTMKKLLLIPALMLATASIADQHKYELSPMIGYNFAEGNLGFDNNGYFVSALEIQANSANSKISPELSVFFTKGGNTNVLRGAFNGVYTFEQNGMFTPFAKLGAGLESFSDQTSANQNGFFGDIGAGAKVAMTENLALKLEAIYMAKVAHQNAGNADSNLLTLVGLTYSFGATAQKTIVEKEVAVVKEEALVVAPVVVESDDDNDGVVNSKDECANTPAGTAVNAQGCPKDSDGDGVIDSLDQCVNTPSGTEVNEQGCPKDSDQDGVTDALDKCPNTLAGTKVDAQGCKEDMDSDGVLNADDICSNTPAGTAVNSDGCPRSITLNVHFENNSYQVKEDSFANLDKYAEFLKTYTNYSAKIIGYTDSRGSASYNKKLSQKRANEVKKLLIQRGVNPSQLSSEGMGEANPIADNATKEGRAKNRRIEAELTRN